jgi:type II secretory pathway pseudopilin PulG
MRRLNEKGITLLELLAAVTLMGIVFTVGFMLIQTMNTGFGSITSRQAVQEQARLITEQVSNQVRAAPSVIEQAGGTLTIRELNSGTATGNYVRYIYSVPRLTVETVKGGETTRFQLGDHLSKAEFIYDPGINKITLKMEFQLSESKYHRYETAVYAPQWGSGS